MNLNKRVLGIVALIVLGAMLVIGCQNNEASSTDNGAGDLNNGSETTPGNEGNNAAGENDGDSEPVELILYDTNAGITEGVMNDLFLEPVGEHHPNISFERISGSGLEGLEEMMTAGQVPDLITASFSHIYDLQRMGLVSDLTPFLDEHNMDISRFNPVLTDILNHFSTEGAVYGIPFSMNYGSMAYNRDIFDHFGESYPTNGMTWNEVINLASRVTAEDDGVQYVGLNPPSAFHVTRSYELPVVDEEQERAVIAEGEYADQYAEAFDLLKQMYDIPGVVEGGELADVNFLNHDLALFPSWIAATTIQLPNFVDAGINWDIVSWPVFESNPGVGRQADFHVLIIPPTSENQDDAWRVIDTVTSDEMQRRMNEGGDDFDGARVTVLDDEEMRSEFGTANSYYDGIDVGSIFEVDVATVPPFTPYTSAVHDVINATATEMGLENIDVNTTLRTAQEEADQVIQEMKQQE